MDSNDITGRPVKAGDRVAYGVRIGQKFAAVEVGTVLEVLLTRHGPNLAIKGPKGRNVAKPPSLVAVVAEPAGEVAAPTEGQPDAASV